MMATSLTTTIFSYWLNLIESFQVNFEVVHIVLILRVLLPGELIVLPPELLWLFRFTHYELEFGLQVFLYVFQLIFLKVFQLFKLRVLGKRLWGLPVPLKLFVLPIGLRFYLSLI